MCFVNLLETYNYVPLGSLWRTLEGIVGTWPLVHCVTQLRALLALLPAGQACFVSECWTALMLPTVGHQGVQEARAPRGSTGREGELDRSSVGNVDC